MTYAQILLMGLLSIVALFPKESEARLFAARLIGVEQEALQQVQLSDSHEGQTNQETSALRRLASALSAGNEAMIHLRGAQTEYREKDRLKLPILGMECDVDRIVNYVSCYDSVIRTREEAVERFIEIVNELQSAFPYISVMRNGILKIAKTRLLSGSNEVFSSKGSNCSAGRRV